MPELIIPTVIDALHHGDITIKGEFVWGSNYTFLAEVSTEDDKFLSVYKPSRGERRLWDFPLSSLACREAAAYLVSEALGWELVPPTVFREDPEVHYFTLSKSDRQSLRPVALYDLLVNNADRKGSHLLFDKNHHLWLIDHGICFHAEDKLRTVIWDFVGEPIPANLLDDLRKFTQALNPEIQMFKELQTLLEPEEVEALIARTKHLISTGQFPEPEPDQRAFPWPLL
jgi:hypothetical protein